MIRSNCDTSIIICCRRSSKASVDLSYHRVFVGTDFRRLGRKKLSQGIIGTLPHDSYRSIQGFRRKLSDTISRKGRSHISLSQVSLAWVSLEGGFDTVKFRNQRSSSPG